MTAYFRWVLRHRIAVLLIFAVFTGLSAASISRVVIASSLGDLFFGDAPEYHDYLARVRQFANDEVFILGYPDPDPLSTASLDRLEAAIDATLKLPHVERVDSLLSVQRVNGSDDLLQIDTYADLAREHPDRRKALLAQLRDDPLGGGLVVSADGQHAAVIVELTVDPARPGEEGTRMVQEVVSQFVDAGFSRESLHQAGFPAVISELVNQTILSFTVQFPLVILVLLVVVILLFRNPIPVALSLSVALFSAVWTMGFAAVLNPRFTVFHGAIPTVIVIVAISDVVHLWSAYLTELNDGVEKDQAILASATDVGSACLLTSVTTFVGFLCLSLVPTPVFRIMGLVLGSGVAIALLLAMTLVPIVASVMPAPPPRTGRPKNPLTRGVDWLVSISAMISTRWPRAVITGFGFFLLASIVGTAQMNFETDFADRLESDNHIQVARRYFDTNFVGTNILDVFVSTATDDDLIQPDLIADLDRLQNRLRALPEVDKVVSFVDVLSELHAKLGGSEVDDGSLPTTRSAISQYLLVFEMAGGEDLQRLINLERQTMRIAVRLHDQGVRTTSRVGSTVMAVATETLGDGVHVYPSGVVYLMGDWLDEILIGQRNGVLLSFVLIAVLMCVGLRSIRAGLWSMIPNVLPVLALGGYVGWMWDKVDSDTLIIAMMGIGIGVDDTIHFLMRYRIERERTDDAELAIQRTFQFAGRAIVMTTIILALGFLPFIISDYFSTRNLGTLLPMCLMVAMVADLLFVPALARVGWIRFGR